MGMFTILAIVFLGIGSLQASAKGLVRDTVRETVKVHYRVGKYNLDPKFKNNKARLDSLVYEMGDAHHERKVTKIEIIGGASPEGSLKLNDMLSHKRAASFIDYLDEFVEIPDSIISYTFLGRDWNGLRKFVVADPEVPQKEEVMVLLDEITSKEEVSEKEGNAYLKRLKKIGNGKSYRYLYKNIFPALRESRFIVHYLNPMRYKLPRYYGLPPSIPLMANKPSLTDAIFLEEPQPITSIIEEAVPKKPLYMALKTNMLYDALAIPNIYAEYYVGKNWSVAGGGMYAWWSYDPRHRYWRVYGGDITARRWFGKAADLKPLTGHHLGINAGVLTFDYEWGGEGYMGGKPRGTLLDRCLFTAGIEYGYSLPVTKRLNIDFSITAGYLGGKYIKYFPYEDYYVRDSEYKITYFGPTKAEISLVWLFGHGNVNLKKAKKGGIR